MRPVTMPSPLPRTPDVRLALVCGVFVGAVACGSRAPPVVATTIALPLPATLAPAPASWAVGGSQAFELVDSAELLQGPAALGELGDFMLRNRRLTAVVRAPNAAGPISGRGGSIVDVALAGGVDAFGELAPVFDADARAFPSIREVVVAQDGRQGGPAIIRASGVDARDDDVRVEIDYVLPPDADFVRVTTTVTHRGRAHYRDHVFGHAIAWGGMRPFAPEVGEPATGARTRTTWIGADGPRSAVALTTEGGLVEAVHGRDFSQTIERAGYLAPGTTTTHTVTLYVGGGGGVAEVATALSADRGAVIGRVEGRVGEVGTGRPVGGAWVVLRRTRGQVTAMRARTRTDGRFVAEVDPGDYTLTAWAHGRAVSPSARVDVRSDAAATADLSLAPPGVLRHSVVKADGSPLAARLSFTGLAGTETPWLGPSSGAPRAGNQLFVLAPGRSKVPPGRYRVGVAAGPTFEVVTREIELKAGQEVPLEVTLPAAFDPAPYVAVDPVTLTAQSPGSGVSPSSRRIACAAEGIDWVAGVDPLGGPAWARDPRRPTPGLGLAGGVLLGGEEGRFAVLGASTLGRAERPMPLPARPSEIIRWAHSLPTPPLVAALRPRAAGTGYFERFSWDSSQPQLPRGGFSLDFDLLQVVGASDTPEERTAVARDLFALTTRGVSVVPFGASGSAETGREWCGLPRTWVRGPVDDGSALVSALKRGDVVASTGPLVTLEVEGVSADGQVTASPSQRLARVRVRAPSWARPDWLDWIEDGQVVEQALVPGNAGEPVDVTLERTLGAGVRWISARAYGDGDLRSVYGPSASRVGVWALTRPIRLRAANP